MVKRPGRAGTRETGTRPRRPRAGSGASLSDLAYDHMRAAILQGTYHPNQRLPEDEGTAELNASRTPGLRKHRRDARM